MKSCAVVFPGQGSQAVSMLHDFEHQYHEIKSVFGEASDCLGYDLWSLVKNGPKEELDRTEITQPALLASGVAVLKIVQRTGGVVPAVLAGHSLGEYSALVAAEVLAFADAILLVRDRGRYMQEAVPAGQGSMAAVLGMEDAELTALCSSLCSGEIVSVANYNCPGQAVIAGNTAAVSRVMDAARSAGAKKVIRLDVSVPSHCALMQPMSEKFSIRLGAVKFNNAKIPVIQNVDAEQRTDAQTIRAALVQQLHLPVRWTDTICKIRNMGINKIVECGPGKVLSGLIKRIDRELTTYPVYDQSTLATALAGLSA
jgi:[acyl-carrier-protein] S-malonyltransferase